jgi:3-deoxy-D-manno-octulosonic-acid transferase
LPGLLTLIAPRHPERGAELGLQLGAPRRAAGAPPPQQGGLYLADTLGELGLFYRLTPLVFMGGSLVPHGGQNPLEAARLGAALLIGPHHHNFAEAVRALAAAGALEVTEDEEALASALARLLAAPEEVRRRGEKGEALLAAAGDLPERYAALLAAAVEGR